MRLTKIGTVAAVAAAAALAAGCSSSGSSSAAGSGTSPAAGSGAASGAAKAPIKLMVDTVMTPAAAFGGDLHQLPHTLAAIARLVRRWEPMASIDP